MKYQFRRGSYNAHITSLSFSPNSKMLCVSTFDSDTIHIYRLCDPVSEVTAGAAKKQSFMMLSPLLVPGVISDIWEPERDYARAKVTSKQNICAVCQIGSGDSVAYQLYVCLPDKFMVFSVPVSGGECVLLRTEGFMDPEEE